MNSDQAEADEDDFINKSYDSFSKAYKYATSICPDEEYQYDSKIHAFTCINARNFLCNSKVSISLIANKTGGVTYKVFGCLQHSDQEKDETRHSILQVFHFNQFCK